MDFSVMAKTKEDNNKLLIDNFFACIPNYIFVFWKDKQSIYLGCNKNYSDFLGLPNPEAIIGKTDNDLDWQPDGDSPDVFQQGDKDTLAGKFIINQKEWLSRRNGQRILTLINKAPLTDKNGQILGVLGIAVDITERAKQDEELVEIKHKLDGMTQAAANIAHEMRTPLTTLKLAVENLQDGLPTLLHSYHLAIEQGLLDSTKYLHPKIANLLDQMLASMRREINMSTLSIDLSLDNLKPNITIAMDKPFSIVACVNQALERYPFKPGELKLIDWKPEADFNVLGEDVMVVHILFNFLKNALYSIKAADKGNIVIWLEIGETTNHLYFKDTGLGISQDLLPHVFDLFVSKTAHGTGVGLSFCKKTMQSLKGFINCDSIEGEYTQFTLSFPVAKQD